MSVSARRWRSTWSPLNFGSIRSRTTRSSRAKLLPRQRQPGLSVGRREHPITLVQQVVGQGREQGRVVLDNEDRRLLVYYAARCAVFLGSGARRRPRCRCLTYHNGSIPVAA